MKPAEPSKQQGTNADWLLQLTDSQNDHVIVCFPYAGMGNAVFGGWRNSVLQSASIIAVQLPGRDGRLRETPIENADEIVEQVIAAMSASGLMDRRITLLGCSFGSILAFELARQLRGRGKQIERLIAAACRPPHSLGVTDAVSVDFVDDVEMVDKLQKWYGAIPPGVIDNPDMLKLVLPAIRADMRVYETYPYRDEEPLSCPITALGGSEDRVVNLNDSNGWRKETTGKFVCRQFAGDHFFLKHQFTAPLKLIERQIR
jgi:surfactin synthase thioesterase subunit